MTRWTPADVAKLAARGMVRDATPSPAPAARVMRVAPGPSKWEAAYRAEILEPLRLGGAIGEPVFEGLRFRVGPGAYYTPDWASPIPGGRLRCDEVKGHMREAARVRILAASEKWPGVEWWIARRAKGGGWVVQRVGGGSSS